MLTYLHKIGADRAEHKATFAKVFDTISQNVPQFVVSSFVEERGDRSQRCCGKRSGFTATSSALRSTTACPRRRAAAFLLHERGRERERQKPLSKGITVPINHIRTVRERTPTYLHRKEDSAQNISVNKQNSQTF